MSTATVFRRIVGRTVLASFIAAVLAAVIWIPEARLPIALWILAVSVVWRSDEETDCDRA